jgi:hypothetical protein
VYQNMAGFTGKFYDIGSGTLSGVYYPIGNGLLVHDNNFNNEFTPLNTAIEASNGVFSNVQIWNNTMNRVNLGIVTNNNVYPFISINQNRISCNTIGYPYTVGGAKCNKAIVASSNSTGFTTATWNTIFVAKPIAPNQTIRNESVNISSNTITSSSEAITCNSNNLSASVFNVSTNKINVVGSLTLGYPILYYGIGIKNNTGQITLKDNTCDGTLANWPLTTAGISSFMSSFTTNNMSGLYAVTNTAPLIHCNDFYGFPYGMYFKNTSTSIATVMGNLMKDNFNQLIIDGGQIGIQGSNVAPLTANFNKWKYVAFAGQFSIPSETWMRNGSNGTASQFFTSIGSTGVAKCFYTPINNINTGGSAMNPISLTATNVDMCSNLLAMSPHPYVGNEWENILATMQGTWATNTPFAAEQTYTGQQQLYKLLTHTDFITNQSADPDVVALGINIPADDYADANAIALHTQTLMQQLNNEPEVQTFITDNATNSIGQFETVEQYIDQADYAAAAATNSSINAILIPETNQQALNSLLINHLANQAIDYTTADYTALMAIATQCEFSGGKAVLQAQSILQGIDAALSFNDIDLCSSLYPAADSTNMRQAVHKAKPSIAANKTDIVLFPNPVSNQLTVISNGYTVNAIEVMDMLGRKMNVTISGINTANCLLNTENLSSGIYQLKIVGVDGSIINRKFVKH